MQEQQILDQMVALSQKKLEMLIKLRTLSEQQKEAFQNKKLHIVEEVLEKKDEIIRYINQLDEAFLKASDTLKKRMGIESLDALSNSALEGRKELKSLIQDITDCVESIIEIEKDCHGHASGMKKEIGNSIKNVNAGKRITKAYNIKSTGAPSYFFDKKK